METVLFVDDEDFVRDLGERILRKCFYKVLCAANGNEALDLIKKKDTPISLVILDLIMPEMGGKEYLNELKRIYPKLKALVASGLSSASSIAECLEIGAQGFVCKPFGMNDLIQQVRKALDSD